MTHLERLQPHAHGKILDLGSGRGGFVRQCQAAGLDVTGVDANPEHVKPYGGVAGTAEKIPFPDNSFDFVNCSELIEHVEDPRAVLAEVRRVLKPDGTAYVSVPNRFGVYDYHYHLWFVNWLPRSVAKRIVRQKNNPFGGRIKQRLEDMHYYSASAFKALVRAYDFDLIDLREHRFPFYPLYRSLVPTHHFLLKSASARAKSAG